ncbi:MAG: DUF4180 domain-containing protein [Clostridiales bacterium]|jgi:hypothetical protein|nr:DUF4180 domain-containing protein [Clostridiales bacterium]
MKYTYLGKNKSIIYIVSDDKLITDAQSALDLMATVYYETNCRKMVLDKTAICEEFFRLSSGSANRRKIINK